MEPHCVQRHEISLINADGRAPNGSVRAPRTEQHYQRICQDHDDADHCHMRLKVVVSAPLPQSCTKNWLQRIAPGPSAATLPCFHCLSNLESSKHCFGPIPHGVSPKRSVIVLQMTGTSCVSFEGGTSQPVRPGRAWERAFMCRSGSMYGALPPVVCFGVPMCKNGCPFGTRSSDVCLKTEHKPSGC